MKKMFSFLALLCFTLVSFLSTPSFAQLIAGHKLTTGQVIVGVTGAAPVANTITGTSNQISVATGAEGGNLTFSFPTNVSMTNLTVTGTLSPYTTGTFTADNATLNYGISAATAVLTNTSATALTVGGGITAGTGVVAIVGADGRIPALSSLQLANLSGASLTTLTAANISAGSLGSSVIASSLAVNSVYANALQAIDPSKITGTAAILGANSFTAAQSVVGGVSISSSATSSSPLNFKGYTLAVSTHGVSLGDVWLENASGTFTIAICTTTVGENAAGCIADGCWLKK